jgi:hypothetical protein
MRRFSAHDFGEHLFEGRVTDSVLNLKHASFELIAHRAVRFFRRVLWYRVRLFGKGKVGIASQICLDHVGIAGERRGNPELLLNPIQVSDAPAWRGFN